MIPHNEEFESHRDVIDVWDSAAEFGRAIGTTRKHVETMRARKSIPSNYWRKVVADAQLRGYERVTFEFLAKLRSKAR